jgi:hypothetical protein
MAAKMPAKLDAGIEPMPKKPRRIRAMEAEEAWQHSRRHANSLLHSSLGVDRGLDAARAALDIDEE